MNDGKPELIRLTEAIERYKISRTTLDKAHNDGLIRKHKLARAVYLDAREIDAWIMGTPRTAN